LADLFLAVAAVLRGVDLSAVGQHRRTADVAHRVARLAVVAPASAALHRAVRVHTAAAAGVVVGAPGAGEPAAARGQTHRRSRAGIEAHPRTAVGATA